MAKTPAKRTRRDRLGVWLFGAYGGLATTLVVGARALAKKLAEPRGLLTETPLCAGLDLQAIDGMVFGGHEVREGDFAASARDIAAQNGTIPVPLVDALAKDLRELSGNVVRGVMPNAGPTIEALVGDDGDATGSTAKAAAKKAKLKATSSPKARAARPGKGQALAAQVEQIQRDLRAFRERHGLDRVVCVNLASTEPPLPAHPAHGDAAAFERALRADDHTAVRPSSLYAWAAASLGLPFVHFTPSNGALLPAIRERFEQNKAPYMGADGKTGETLVKSALAPMFKYRNLRVLTWQGYNILGDRDGRVLADADNKSSKVATKDGLLPQILGYPLHTHVGIDYVPSLHDLKTAWDFIHFEGFLGHRMVMQFIWQGCDAILAAPLVLDLVRFVDFAHRRGESGALPHLACFFKQPIGTGEHDLHAQWHMLTEYVARHRKAAGS